MDQEQVFFLSLKIIENFVTIVITFFLNNTFKNSRKYYLLLINFFIYSKKVFKAYNKWPIFMVNKIRF